MRARIARQPDPVKLNVEGLSVTLQEAMRIRWNTQKTEATLPNGVPGEGDCLFSKRYTANGVLEQLDARRRTQDGKYYYYGHTDHEETPENQIVPGRTERTAPVKITSFYKLGPDGWGFSNGPFGQRTIRATVEQANSDGTFQPPEFSVIPVKLPYPVICDLGHHPRTPLSANTGNMLMLSEHPAFTHTKILESTHLIKSYDRA
jgi:hypothetical protein